MSRCNLYMGDSDGTNPQLTCIRGKNHPGACDNLHGDHQVWAMVLEDMQLSAIPISHVYDRKNNAEIVARWAKVQLPGIQTIHVMSTECDDYIDYGGARDTPTQVLSHDAAMELFGRLGW